MGNKRTKVNKIAHSAAALMAGAAAAGISGAYKSKIAEGAVPGISMSGGERDVINLNSVSATSYTKKRKPKPKTIARKERFKAKVESVLAEDKGTISVVRLQASTSIVTTSATTSQNSQSWSLYGINGAAGSNDDVKAMMSDASIGGGGTPAGSGAELTFQTGRIEFIMRSRSTNTNHILVDVYRLRAKNDIAAVAATATANVHWAAALALDTGGTTPLTNATYGCTPFQSPQFCRYYDIEEKDTHRMGPGEIVKFDYVDTFNKKFSQTDYVSTINNLASKKKWTTHFLLVVREIFPFTITNGGAGLDLTVSKTFRVSNAQILRNINTAL